MSKINFRIGGLSKGEFQALEKRLFDEMYRAAQRGLVKKMFNVLATRENCIGWFYTPKIALSNKSPCDYCKAGKHSDISDLLDRIEYGVIS